MNTTCPSCGRPIRPGSKFCGNCGATLPLSPAGKPSAATPPPSPGGMVCPYCGKPVRSEARFCPSCGQNLPKAVSPQVTPPPGELKPVTPPPGVLKPVSPQPQPTPPPSALKPVSPPVIATEKPPKAAPPPPSEIKPAPKGRTGKFWVFVGGASILILVLVAFSGLMLSKSGVFDRATETPTAINTNSPTLTIASSLTSTLTPSQTALPTLTPSITLSPSPLPSLTAKKTLTSSPTLATTQPASLSISPTGTTPGNALLLEETFSSTDLNQNWITWGTAYAVRDGHLEFNGQVPDETGIYSKKVFLAKSGMIIRFIVRLTDTSPQDVILFNWDQIGFGSRKAGSLNGLIHIRIGGDNPTIIVGTKGKLPGLPSDTNSHTYEIRVLGNGSLTFFIDGTEKGTLPSPAVSINGSISFSGKGWIDDIVVIQSAASN